MEGKIETLNEEEKPVVFGEASGEIKGSQNSEEKINADEKNAAELAKTRDEIAETLEEQDFIEEDPIKLEKTGNKEKSLWERLKGMFSGE